MIPQGQASVPVLIGTILQKDNHGGLSLRLQEFAITIRKGLLKKS